MPPRRGSRRRGSVVPDEHLARRGRLLSGDRVAGLHRLDLEGPERLPHLGHIVEAQEEPALNLGQQAGQAGEVLSGEQPFAVEPLHAEVRRVQVEEGPGPVVARDELRPGQPLDGDPGQAQVRLAQVLLQAEEIDARPLLGAAAEGPTGHLSAEALTLDVVEPGRALDVGQPAGCELAVPVLPPFAAGQAPLELPAELLQVVLEDPVEGDQVTVDVVDDLAARGLLAEQHPRRTGKDLTVGLVSRDTLDDLGGQQRLAADPTQRTPGNAHASTSLRVLPLPATSLATTRVAEGGSGLRLVVRRSSAGPVGRLLPPCLLLSLQMENENG